MLKRDPKERIKAKDALGHPWFRNAKSSAELQISDEEKDKLMEKLVIFQGRSKLRKTVLNM